MSGPLRAPLHWLRAVLAETAAADILDSAGYQRHRIERGTQPYGHFLYVRPRRSTGFGH